MLYRKQTLFILATIGLLISLFFLPMITFIGGEEKITYLEYFPSAVMVVLSLILCISTLSLHKKPLVQTRVSGLTSLILVGFQSLLAVKYFQRVEEMSFSISTVFPIIAAILMFIAMRLIARDVAILMASQRLRSPRRRR